MNIRICDHLFHGHPPLRSFLFTRFLAQCNSFLCACILREFWRMKYIQRNDGQRRVRDLPSSPSPSSSSSLMSRLSGCGPFGPSSSVATDSEMKSSSPVAWVCRSRPRFSLATFIDDSEGMYDADSSVFFSVAVSFRRHQRMRHHTYRRPYRWFALTYHRHPSTYRHHKDPHWWVTAAVKSVCWL